MAKPTALQTAIFNSGQRQIVIARWTGIHETRLSKIAHGHVPATPDEKKDLAKVLKTKVDELFPEAAAP